MIIRVLDFFFLIHGKPLHVYEVLSTCVFMCMDTGTRSEVYVYKGLRS